MYNVAVVGFRGAGKSCIINKLFNGEFRSIYKPTCGVKGH